MIARSELVPKDAFAPQFVSIQAILGSVDFLAKFSSSCFYMLSLS